MIKISSEKYINKYQIISIVDRYDNYVINMSNGDAYYVFKTDYEYYLNIRKLVKDGE